MGNYFSVCNQCNQYPVEYVEDGNLLDIYFRENKEEYPKKITVHDENILRKAIEIYQEEINKNGLKIQKAIYEPDKSKLPLNKKLCELTINFSNTIIVYLR